MGEGEGFDPKIGVPWPGTKEEWFEVMDAHLAGRSVVAKWASLGLLDDEDVAEVGYELYTVGYTSGYLAGRQAGLEAAMALTRALTPAQINRLTTEQQRCLAHVAGGKTYAQTAAVLKQEGYWIEQTTVKHHATKAARALGMTVAALRSLLRAAEADSPKSRRRASLSAKADSDR